MRPFITDDEIARRLRDVETELLERGLRTLADQLGELIRLLEDQETA